MEEKLREAACFGDSDGLTALLNKGTKPPHILGEVMMSFSASHEFFPSHESSDLVSSASHESIPSHEFLHMEFITCICHRMNSLHEFHCMNENRVQYCSCHEFMRRETHHTKINSCDGVA